MFIHSKRLAPANFSGNVEAKSGFVANTARIADLTQTRVVFAGASGELSDDANFTYDSTTDTLTFVAGSNMTITTDASGDSVTFASSGSGSGSSAFTFANMSLNEFSGDDSTTAFTLGQTPGNENNLIVFVIHYGARTLVLGNS